MTISRRHFLDRTGRSLGAAVVGMSTLRKAEGEQQTTQRPNILWIMTDQQPVSTLGCYGNALNLTPNLDRLAKEGVRFDRFHIAAFPCSPSRACFLTGLYSHQHGVTTNDVALNPDIPTLGTICRDAGYATAYFGKSHLNGNMYRSREGSPESDEQQDWQYRRVDNEERFEFEKVPGGIGEDGPQLGFEEWGGGWKDYHAYLREVGLGKLVDENPRLGNHNDLPSTGDHAHAYSQLPEEHHMAAFFRKRAVDFIQRQERSENPFCMVVSFFGPHLPVAPPQPWDTKYSLDEISLPANHEDDLKNKPLGQFQNKRCYRGNEWTEEQYKDYIRRYYGYCAYIDAQIGMIFDALEASVQADNTIVVFTSDHGDMIAAHGMVFKLVHCGYDELLRVPFLMRYSGHITPGAATGMLASSVDALPTVLEYAGLHCPKEVAGRSMANELESTSFRDYVFCDSMEISFTVTDGRWKFVANVNTDCCNELYDRETDLGELVNLFNEQEHAETRQRMRDALAQWLHDSSHPYATRIIHDMDMPLGAPARMYPEVRHCEYLGNRRFSFGYDWHVETNPELTDKYWSYCQFRNASYGTDGDIAFRLVKWPDKPTPEWNAGDTIPISPAEIEIPDAVGAGEYEVHIGLYEPDKKKNVAFAPPYVGVVGILTVAADKSGSITGVTFKPAKNSM